jgi:hypothetical protein
MYLWIAIAGFLAVVVFSAKKKTEEQEGETLPEVDEFPVEWRIILAKKVAFYNSLTEEERSHFEFRVQEFLANCRITGVQTNIDDTDRLLVASSAVIPVFRFPEWTYSNLCEVLLYPSAFDEKFRTSGPDRTILGMVGTGYMEGKMILSRPALHHGFGNESDKKNTGVHEFIHLIDKMDNRIDGIPVMLMEKQYAIPWLTLIEQKIEEIYANKSDVNPYGGTSRIEFFAVISEYFFERLQLLAKSTRNYTSTSNALSGTIWKSGGWNANEWRSAGMILVPAAAEKKFKKCCGGVHFSGN